MWNFLWKWYKNYLLQQFLGHISRVQSQGPGQRLWLSNIPGQAKSRLRPKVRPGFFWPGLAQLLASGWSWHITNGNVIWWLVNLSIAMSQLIDCTSHSAMIISRMGFGYGMCQWLAITKSVLTHHSWSIWWWTDCNPGTSSKYPGIWSCLFAYHCLQITTTPGTAKGNGKGEGPSTTAGSCFQCYSSWQCLWSHSAGSGVRSFPTPSGYLCSATFNRLDT